MKKEDNEDFIYWKFTGGKTIGINENWSDARDSLDYLRNIPLKDDIINFSDWLGDEGQPIILRDFGTTLFIVIQRQLLVPTDGEPHLWYIYIKPYFPNQE